ncbi:MAG: hypothetical protein ABIQ47_07200 [Tepidiformaceae bacterium]
MTAVVVNAVAGSERFADRDGGLCIAEAIGAGEDLEEHAVETDDVVFSGDALVLEAEFSVCLGSGEGRPVGTVKRRLKRARKAGRKAFACSIRVAASVIPSNPALTCPRTIARCSSCLLNINPSPIDGHSH